MTVETEIPSLSRKQATKLGDILSYRERNEDVIC